MVKTCEKLDYCGIGKSQPFLILLLIADVITIDKTNENFRLLYDVKGRFTIHRIKQEEAMVNITSDLQNICFVIYYSNIERCSTEVNVCQ